MKKHEFYQKYANTPLNLREIPLSLINNDITLNGLYFDIKHHDEEIAKAEEKQTIKIKLAEEIFKNIKNINS